LSWFVPVSVKAQMPWLVMRSASWTS